MPPERRGTVSNKTITLSARKSHAGTRDDPRLFLRENLGERVVLSLQQGFHERRRKGTRLCDIEAFEHPMAHETAGSKEGLVDVGSLAVDRADDVESQEIEEHPVGEVQNGADLISVVGFSGHQRIIRVFEDDDELSGGILSRSLDKNPMNSGSSRIFRQVGTMKLNRRVSTGLGPAESRC
jgi:hypothetical protein